MITTHHPLSMHRSQGGAMNVKAEADQGPVATDPGPRETRLGPRMVPLDDLLPHPLNSNVMSPDAKRRALTAFAISATSRTTTFSTGAWAWIWLGWRWTRTLRSTSRC